ncbi:MAG: HDIG domain-containing protein [Phycisphaeraceae bacterium]|nr:MAG: HDIG domain-containing protein [Phycisphaeraceae bacterium]
MNVAEARSLMEEWTPSASLRVHMETVAASMRAYAERLEPGEADRWVVCGLLHDFDYEKHPTPEEHPFVGVKHLETLGVDEEIRTAILGHAAYTGAPRETPMARALFAVDELSGFIVACSKVRPDGIATLAPKSVKKKLKDKAFAAAVSREDIRVGMEELGETVGDGFDPTSHIQTCIDAIRGEAERLGL